MDNSLYSYIKNKMAQKIVNELHDKTPHKDRLVLVALVAILAFTLVNTLILTTDIALAASSVV